jgi:NAD(P)-dependent dehydrogenase (short-subunit alcohol dehydrogenase family)
LLHPSKKVNDGDKGGLMSTELRDFRTAWDDEPERLNSKGKKQCGERQSLQKYTIPFSESESTEVLRDKLADFYAQRTLTFLPQDCAAAVVWLAGDQSAKTTGHVIPVDGGLSEMQPVPAM